MDAQDIYVVHGLYITSSKVEVANTGGNRAVAVSTDAKMNVHYLHRPTPPKEKFDALVSRLMVSEANDVGNVVNHLVEEHGFNHLNGINGVVVKKIE